MNEIWKRIPGYPLYEISNKGCVRSYFGNNCKTIVETPRRVNPNTQNGYKRFSARDSNGKMGTCKVHSKVLETFTGPRPHGYDGCHLDGNKENNCINNLTWASRKDNMRHRDEHGRTIKGTQMHLSKLCEDDVKEIRRLASGENASMRELGRMYGVHNSTIKAVIDRRTWKQVE